MSVWYFSCENCNEAASEYDEIHCEKCESALCSCAMPEEIHKLCGCWEDIWNHINTDKDNNIIPKVEEDEEKAAIFRKYLSCNDYYGIVLKEEYCPVCQRRKENEKDPEYAEYLRLKAKFDNFQNINYNEVM